MCGRTGSWDILAKRREEKAVGLGGSHYSVKIEPGSFQGCPVRRKEKDGLSKLKWFLLLVGFFPLWGCWALAQVAQGDCEVFTLADIQKPSGCGPRQPAWLILLRKWGWTSQSPEIPSSLSQSVILCCSEWRSWLSFLFCRILILWNMPCVVSIICIYSSKWILHLFGFVLLLCECFVLFFLIEHS